MNNHTRARDFYHRALQIAPNEPSILNNLGLSYVLTKELALAETTLRKAVSQPRRGSACPRQSRTGTQASGAEYGKSIQSRGGSTGSGTCCDAPGGGAGCPPRPRRGRASVSGSLWKASQQQALPAKTGIAPEPKAE